MPAGVDTEMLEGTVGCTVQVMTELLAGEATATVAAPAGTIVTLPQYCAKGGRKGRVDAIVTANGAPVLAVSPAGVDSVMTATTEHNTMSSINTHESIVWNSYPYPRLCSLWAQSRTVGCQDHPQQKTDNRWSPQGRSPGPHICKEWIT